MRTTFTRLQLIQLAYLKQFGSTKGMLKQQPKIYLLNGEILVSTKSYDMKLPQLYSEKIK